MEKDNSEFGTRMHLRRKSRDCREMPEDSSWKCYLKCCNMKLGIFTSTNEVDVKKWSESFEGFNISLAQKCANIVEPDLCQKSHLMVKCVHDELSKHYLQ